MSTENTPAPQTNEVYVTSLPWSLRHSSMHAAAEEARDIAAFLCEVTTSPRMDGFSPDDIAFGDWKNGLHNCFHLLIDKLDIIAGVYEFPTLTHDESAPRLCHREGDEGGSHE